MKTPEQIFDEALQARGIDRIGLQDAEVYEAGLDAIKQALSIAIVSQQRELLIAYEKNHYTPQEWALASKQCVEDIDNFLAINCG